MVDLTNVGFTISSYYIVHLLLLWCCSTLRQLDHLLPKQMMLTAWSAPPSPLLPFILDPLSNCWYLCHRRKHRCSALVYKIFWDTSSNIFCCTKVCAFSSPLCLYLQFIKISHTPRFQYFQKWSRARTQRLGRSDFKETFLDAQFC